MSTSSGLGTLPAIEWSRFQAIAERFEQAWRQGKSVDVGAFLPPVGDPLRPVVLRELIKLDLSLRWQHSQPRTLEDYLKEFPELGSAQTIAADLIFEEYRVRHRYGDKPTLEVYKDRFPSQYTELQQLESNQPVTQARLDPTPTSPQHATPLHSPGPLLTVQGGQSQLMPVGGYRLLRRIGSGGFGEVWSAEAPGGVPVAVKIIFRPLDHEDAKQELKALEMIKRLHHRFLLQTHAFWSLQDRLIVVMDLADGSLRSRDQECRRDGLSGIPVAELLRYFGEAAQALDYLHSQKLVHRDIKPDNILLQSGHALVADFGLARTHITQRSGSAPLAGTLPYMAPEVFRGKVHYHSDQYSLAATYAELRLGRRPFGGDDLVEVMRNHCERPPDLSGLTEAEQQVLLKALAKDHKQRYRSCQEFVQALEQALLERPSPPPPRRWRSGALLALATSLLSIFLVWVIVPRFFRAVELVPPEPIEIRAEGEGETIRIRATRRWFKDPIPLLFPDLPKGVVVSQGAVIPADSDDIEVQLLADRTARPGTRTVTVRAEAANQPEVTFPLTIHQGHWEPNWEVVPGAEPVQDATGKWYYRQIDVRRGGQRVRFLLVEKLATDDPAISCSFYIMRDKVSNGLFQAAVGDPEFEKLLARFAGCHEKAVQRKWPQPPPDGAKDWNNLPMLNATAAEAHAFALWLGGKLPTDSQWWKAAGARHPDWKSPGPFRPVVRPLVAVGIPQAMPMGEDTDDVGPYGCRYMAGNGLEWTRTEHITNADWTERLAGQALPSNIDILLTGREYHFPQPLLFKDRDDRPRETERFSYVPRGDIGFRVVIELR